MNFKCEMLTHCASREAGILPELVAFCICIACGLELGAFLPSFLILNSSFLISHFSGLSLPSIFENNDN